MTNLDELIDIINKFQFLLLTEPYLAFAQLSDLNDDFSTFLNSLKRMYYSGLSPLKPVQGMVRNLMDARLWLFKRYQLESLLVGRLLLVVCIVSAFKIMLAILVPLRSMDIYFLIFDTRVLFGGVFVYYTKKKYFEWFYPTHWFWDFGMSDTGRLWIEAKFNGTVSGECSFARNICPLKAKEIAIGQQLHHEIEQYIDSWALQLDVSINSNREKFEDKIPLFEFTLFSSYTMFLLYSPVKEIFTNSLYVSF